MSRKLQRDSALLLVVALLMAWPAGAAKRRAAKRPADRTAAHARGLQKAKRTATRGEVAHFGRQVAALLSAGGAERGYWGVLVSDADTGKVLYALHAARYFEPASNGKLFTTAMALATLGPEFCIRTTIVTPGFVDRGGRLHGNLILLGRGDANLSNRVFPYDKKDEQQGPPEKVLAQMADQVVAHGVNEIDGDVVADDSYFDLDRFPSGWTLDDTVWGYGAAVSAIAVNDNIVTLQVRPGEKVGAPLQFDLEPRAGFYRVQNDSVTTAAGTEPQLRIARGPGSRVFHLSGSMPLNAPPRLLELGVEEPAEHTAALLARLLEERGVRINGRSRAQHADSVAPLVPPPQYTVLAEHVSPPLIDDVQVTNKDSLNLHAELMLRVTAREKAGARTMDDALKFAEQFRQRIGLRPESVLMKDGSGLSRDDLVTPEAVVRLLAWCARQPWGRAFAASFPEAGEDGTLADRMKGTVATGRVHAKTGMVDHVVALSGYATTVRGEHLIFSMFGNNNGTGSHDGTAVLDSICVAMVRDLGPVRKARPAAGTRPHAR